MQSIKITDTALKGLQLLRAMENVKQSEFASVAIVEAIERDYPDVYATLKKVMTKEETDNANPTP